MEKIVRLAYLYDIYGGLLTEKQRQIFSLYVNEDVTVSEIAELTNVSRQAVSDLIRRIEKILGAYDDKLHLFEKYLQNCETADRLRALVAKNEDAARLADELKNNL
jgi:predicted DNA-binding protein YlxM (UPF0122 family)